MDIMKMMKQAQTLQKKLKDTQEELAQQEFSAESAGGAVKVTCNGQGKFKSIKLSAQAINPENPDSVDQDTIETLEDIINDAIIKTCDEAKEKMEKKMKSLLPAGLNIPGLM